MGDVFRLLAQRLDQLPNGFPATASGVELKVLKRIFSPEDAEVALKLSHLPETAEAVAERLDRPLEEMKAVLDGMAERGQIGCFKMSGKQVYVLMPFVIGIYEFQLNRLDEELAELFNEYRPHLTRSLGAFPPALTRVVPAGVAIKAEHEVLRYEDMHRMISEARSFVLRECICRKQRALEGRPCSHLLEACLGFSGEENAYDEFTHAGRIITRDEAYRVLEATAKEGLVYCTYNVKDGQRFVCSCCVCCCELLRGLKNHMSPHILAGSNFQAAIDAENCSTCGACAEERCMMDAIVQEDGAYKVTPERCIGCGVCAITCPTGSITLSRKKESERDDPPANLAEWNALRASNRSKASGD